MKRKIVSSDPEIMHGALVFAGTRVLARSLWDCLEAGDGLDEFVDSFPGVSREQAIGLINQAKERTTVSAYSTPFGVRSFMRLLGRHAQGSRAVYMTGGASAAILGWRDFVVDIDVIFETEHADAVEAIARVKEEMSVNVDLSAPDAFIATLPGWRERSVHIARHGAIDILHYDFYSQALAKISRGHDQDLRDVRAMHRRKLIEPQELLRLSEAIEPHPPIHTGRFRDQVQSIAAELKAGGRAKINQVPSLKREVQDLPFEFPGASLVNAGIASLGRGETTIEALLVAVAAGRLSGLGLDIPEAVDAIEEPNLALYAAVCEDGGGHAGYNALLERLVNFANAADWLLRDTV